MVTQTWKGRAEKEAFWFLRPSGKNVFVFVEVRRSQALLKYCVVPLVLFVLFCF